MIAMSQEQFDEEDYRNNRQKQCLKLLKRGLTVIHDRCLLLQVEILAGFSPKINVAEYRSGLILALQRMAEEIYGPRLVAACAPEAKVDTVEYALDD